MQYEVLESIRNSNEIRLARNREYVGGLIFLIACAMLEFAVAVGLLQAYVIPLGRCCRPLRSLKLTSFLFSVTNTVLYFGISALSGLTAFIVMTVLLLVLLIGLAILGAVRRYLAQKELESALVGAGATPNAGGRGCPRFGNGRVSSCILLREAYHPSPYRKQPQPQPHPKIR